MSYARSGLRRARLGEALCFGAAAGMGVAATALLGGVDKSLELCWLGVGVGSVAGATWLLGAPVQIERVARRIDRKLRFEGALVTAWEGEREADSPSGLAALLSERVRLRLRKRDALAAVLPPLAPAVVVLLVGVAVLFLGLTREEARVEKVDVASLVGAARERLVAARSEALEGLESGDTETAEAQAMIDAVQALEAWTPESGASGLERLEDALDQGAGIDPELALELERAKAQLEAARAELLRQNEGSSGTEGDPETAGSGASGPEGLTPGGEDGMMTGSSGGSEGPTTEDTKDGDNSSPPSIGDPLREGATFCAWWPDEYDGFVRAWVDETH